ncbi:Hsp20/alpha crystallin family protein [Brevibacillus ginsengisoli]|uniref:Hsp20/alpha crystallin family protein n=1 Tax=Brevibacillus ginsengisoli TaxID=363854 RepID=UPI003CEA84C7
MKDIQELLKHLQNINQLISPLQTAGFMHEAFGEKFWDSMSKLTNSGVNHMDVEQSQLAPQMDVFQTKTKVIVYCEIPGLQLDSLEVSLDNSRQLMIKGTIIKKTHPGVLVKRERFFGNFLREIKLPHPVSTVGMKRIYQDGLLELHFIKKSIKSGSRGSALFPWE